MKPLRHRSRKLKGGANSNSNGNNAYVNQEVIDAILDEKTVDKLKELIANGADINSTDNDHESTPLNVAFGLETPEFAIALLDAPGIDVNARSRLDTTALHTACRYGQDETLYAVEKLLDMPGIDIHAIDNYGNTPLHYAVQNETITEMLLEKEGIRVNVSNKDGNTPLHFAAARGSNGIEAMKRLLQHPDIDKNALNKEGYSPLTGAIDYNEIKDDSRFEWTPRPKGDYSAVIALLETGADKTKGIIVMANKRIVNATEYANITNDRALQRALLTKLIVPSGYLYVEPNISDIFGEDVTDGAIVAVLNPVFKQQYIVAVAADRHITHGWQEISKKKQNPFTRADFNPEQVLYQTVIVGPAVNMNGGKRRKTRKVRRLRRSLRKSGASHI